MLAVALVLQLYALSGKQHAKIRDDGLGGALFSESKAAIAGPSATATYWKVASLGHGAEQYTMLQAGTKVPLAEVPLGGAVQISGNSVNKITVSGFGHASIELDQCGEIFEAARATLFLEIQGYNPGDKFIVTKVAIK